MGFQNRDRVSELDAFKKINLSVIASSFGYQIVKNKSTRHSVLMQSSNDKIIVSKNGSHYVFCSVYNTAANGTVIDFVQKIVEPNCSLGRVRQHLRPFLDWAYYSTVEKKHEGRYAKSIRPSTTDFMAVAARFSGFEPVTKYHPYLCGERGIPLDLLQQDRLTGRVFHCPRRRSTIFPHWGSVDDNASNTERCLTGYEIKGSGVNLFSKGGRKGLWSSRGFESDRILVFCESGLDALSYLALHASDDTRAISISGQINSHQPELIKSAIGKMRKGAVVVAGFDNDEAGDRLTETLKRSLDNSRRRDIEFRLNRPPEKGQDWNDALISTQKCVSQTLCVEHSMKL